MGNAEKLVALLRSLQLSAQSAYPNRRMPRMDTLVVMVSVKEQKLEHCALADRFGGIRALAYEETVLLELYSPYLLGGNRCEQTAQTILDALADAFADLSLSAVTKEATYYDADTDCFRCRLCVVTKAYLSAEEG